MAFTRIESSQYFSVLRSISRAVHNTLKVNSEEKGVKVKCENFTVDGRFVDGSQTYGFNVEYVTNEGVLHEGVYLLLFYFDLFIIYLF